MPKLSLRELQIAELGDVIVGQVQHQDGVPTDLIGKHASSDGRDRQLLEMYVGQSLSMLSSYATVQKKAAEIYRSGGVDPIRLAPDFSEANITCTSGETYYNVLKIGTGPSIQDWVCECAWSNWNYDRAPEYKRFEHRKCAHSLAHLMYLQAFVGATRRYFQSLPSG